MGFRSRTWSAPTSALIALALLIVAMGVPKTAQADAIIDRTVEFEVVNTNDSLVRCDSDGKPYTLRGSLVGPASFMRHDHRAVTLYIHGAWIAGDNLWRMQPGGDASFDYGYQMALRGHASVSIELVGYGSSVTEDGPDGNAVCQGSQADVIGQVVERLRTGAYRWGDRTKGPAFARVGLAGLSYGVQFSQPAAYSFRNIDALIVMGYAEPPIPGTEAVRAAAEAGQRCAPPGESKYDDGTGPLGYHSLDPEPTVGFMFNDPDPVAEAESVRLSERDPCGQASSIPSRAVTDAQHLQEITVPVLLAFGAKDEFFGQPGPQIHFQRFTGSADRTLMLFPNAGHAFFLETKRAFWIEMIAGWLDGHDL